MGLWPQFQQPQKAARDTDIWEKDKKKLAKFLRQGYVSEGEVRIPTHNFSATKGGDIRLVYSGTSSGLNNTLCAPHLSLPTVASTLRAVDGGGIHERAGHRRDIIELHVE